MHVQLYPESIREAKRNRVSGSHAKASTETGKIPLQQEVQQSHDYIFRAVYKFSVPGNDFDNNKQKKVLAFFLQVFLHNFWRQS